MEKSVIYEVRIEPDVGKNSFHITYTNVAGGTQESFEQSVIEITQDEVSRLWLESSHQLAIGQKLFRFLEGGDARCLSRALEEAHDKGEKLLLYLRTCKSTADWPFELLADNQRFLLPTAINLVRRVSDWGAGQIPTPEDRPLKLLFMASSAIGVQPELDFEREEEAIFQITSNLAIDMEVEDSGSLEGLSQRLMTERYDVIHLCGHAKIDKTGKPFFIMEDETGFRQNVYPEQLWNKALINHPPHLLFLSGCHTGQTPENQQAAVSFAQRLVEEYYLPAVLGWGQAVWDSQARKAAEVIYQELSRGRDVPSAVQRARYELTQLFQDCSNPVWQMLRLYSAGVPFSPFITEGQKLRPKPRELIHTYLKNSQVKVLKEGFVGRRRQLQHSLRTLKEEQSKVGLLLHGTAGLGKSCLAGKLCERFKQHTLIIVHGRLDAISLTTALTDAFIISQDEKGKEILATKKEMEDKLADLCATSFKEKNYLLLFDDFEQNLEGAEQGRPGNLLPATVPLMNALLHYLSFCGKMSHLVITGRYQFSLIQQGKNLIQDRLESICLTGFTYPERCKKLYELPHILNYPQRAIAWQLLASGFGNPRLMEWLDILVGQMPGRNELLQLLDAVKDKQEEFIQKYVIRQLLTRAKKDTERFINWFSVFRQPVLKEGARCIGEKAGLPHWEELLNEGVRLSLIEYELSRYNFFITPLLRQELWSELGAENDRLRCHQAGFEYYQKVCADQKGLDPVSTEEWIYHSLGCGKEDVAVRQAGRLVTYLGKHLAYRESKRIGEWVIASKRQKPATEDDAFLLNAFAFTLHTLGEHQKAIGYLEQALAIDKAVFDDQHPEVAIRLNNLGEAWRALGEPKKAIGYYEQALKIWKVVYGEKHPNVATTLNNLGLAWDALGEPKKAIGYYEQALKIWKAVYGEKHPNVASALNNLGAAYFALGEKKKAKDYFQQAYEIFYQRFRSEHPHTKTADKWLAMC